MITHLGGVKFSAICDKVKKYFVNLDDFWVSPLGKDAKMVCCCHPYEPTTTKITTICFQKKIYYRLRITL